MKDPRPPQGAQSALRAIRLLKQFTGERPEMTLAELAAAAGLEQDDHAPPAAGIAERGADRAARGKQRLQPGPGLMALGVQALASSDLRRRVRPMLRTLARDIGETATLEVPVEESMLILDEVAGSHVVTATGNVGTRWPLHATSTGKVWLAFDEGSYERLHYPLASLTRRTLTSKVAFEAELARVRRSGYGVTVDELEEGFTAVATVIRGALGDVQGALSIGGPTQRLGAARRAKIGKMLCQAASRLSPEY
ncbi:MAG: IclR family transcriptional regulator [Woeseiaceae bacterium]|nr:IclR family transcriptional regulator [Woeseiaceae bacterium]